MPFFVRVEEKHICSVKKIRIYLQKVADNNIIVLKKGWDCHVKEI